VCLPIPPKPPSPPADVEVPVDVRPIEPCLPPMKFKCNGSRCGCTSGRSDIIPRPIKPPSPPADPDKPPSPPADPDKPPSPPADVDVPVDVKVAGKCFLNVSMLVCTVSGRLQIMCFAFVLCSHRALTLLFVLNI